MGMVQKNNWRNQILILCGKLQSQVEGGELKHMTGQ